MHAWDTVDPMATVQIRNLSDEVHRELKAEAAAQGQSLSEYLRVQLERWAGYLTHGEMIEHIRSQEPYAGPSLEELTAIVREDRDGH